MPNEKDTTIIYWTDGLNPPRVLTLPDLLTIDESEPPFSAGAPQILTFGLSSSSTTITITWSIDDNDSVLTNIEYQLDGGSWTSIGGAVYSENGNTTITGLNTSQQYSVNIRATNAEGTTTGTAKNITTSGSTVITAPSPLSPKFFGFWDGQKESAGEGTTTGNTVKGWSVSQARDLHNTYNKPAIISGMGFDPNDDPSVWRSKLQGSKSTIHDIGSANTRFILLLDEPYSKGWTKAQLEQLVEIGREVLNTDGESFRFAYTVPWGVTQGWSGNQEDQPDNVDYLGLNLYLFRKDSSAYDSKNAWTAEFNDAVSKLKAKSNTSYTRFFLTGQGFKGWVKWKQPLDQSPYWTAEAVQNEPDMDGLLWFEYTSRDADRIGSEDMPTIYANIKDAYNTLF